MTRNDHAALKLAIEQARADDAKQIDAMLAEDSWEGVALFAAYHCQAAMLRLKPWEIPPCHIDDPDEPDLNGDPGLGRDQAVRLLRQMYDLGISRWHPDPVAAIAAARRHGTA